MKNWVLFHTNSVTFKKSFLNPVKLFDERLRLHQDAELWLRLIKRGKFIASEWEFPVAVVRRHPNNRIIHKNQDSYLLMYAVFVDNEGIDQLYDFEIDKLFQRVLRLKSGKIQNQLIRRSYYYFSFFFLAPFKTFFLSSFSKNLCSKFQ